LHAPLAFHLPRPTSAVQCALEALGRHELIGECWVEKGPLPVRLAGARPYPWGPPRGAGCPVYPPVSPQVLVPGPFPSGSLGGPVGPPLRPSVIPRALIALRKKDGGVRPIAVGDTLRRLVAKWLLASAQGRNAAAALAPLQTAFLKGSPCDVVAVGL